MYEILTIRGKLFNTIKIYNATFTINCFLDYEQEKQVLKSVIRDIINENETYNKINVALSNVNVEDQVYSTANCIDNLNYEQLISNKEIINANQLIYLDVLLEMNNLEDNE